ncbi:hypothetical protein ACM66B_003439 [Microbotryomycetes sp. NB124-2]
MTSLTLARALIRYEPRLPLKLTFIDKARNPGGRMTSRTYDQFDNVTLETGLRVFQASNAKFRDEVERWAKNEWVAQANYDQLKGVAGTKQGLEWYQATGGVTNLINHLVDEIKQAGQDRVTFHFNTTVTKPSPTFNESGSLSLNLDPTIDSLELIDIVILTAPVPQVDAFLPSSNEIKLDAVTEYAQTFVWLLPTIQLPSNSPIYHRNPSDNLTSIAQGVSKDGKTNTGLVLQATPQQLGLVYDKDKTTDDDIKRAFLKVIENDKDKLLSLSDELVREIEGKRGRESQIKRWKFAQVRKAVEQARDGAGPTGDDKGAESRVWSFKEGRVLVAGDGTDTGCGGVQGAWLAGTETARKVAQWIQSRDARL